MPDTTPHVSAPTTPLRAGVRRKQYSSALPHPARFPALRGVNYTHLSNPGSVTLSMRVAYGHE